MRIKSKKFKKKNILIASSILVLIIFSILKFQPFNTIPHQNLVDQKISLYSDKHITNNAILTQKNYQKLVFEPAQQKSAFGNNLATAIKSFESFLTLPQETKDKKEREYGSWVWTPTMNLNQEYIDSLITESKANGINAIYISIDSYLDIFLMEKGGEREKHKELFSQKLEYFIKKANQKGIVVDAEAGWRNWAEAGNEYKALAVANFVKDFNETHDFKFRGFQYDIEPYLLDEFKTDPEIVLKNYISLVDKTRNFLQDNSLKFSVVIPDFYDEKDEMTPKFTYNNKKASVFEHLLDILDQKDGSSIVIMSYRTFADGYDGSIEISQNEMQTAKAGNYHTKIIIAQETGDVPPPYITFHRTSKKHLEKQVEKINNAFNEYSNFGGIAFHYLNSLLALK